jgi:hypothetical protein
MLNRKRGAAKLVHRMKAKAKVLIIVILAIKKATMIYF